MQLLYQSQCGKCGEPGHNARTCGKDTPTLESELERSERHCGACGKPGHNARTCSAARKKKDVSWVLDRIEQTRLKSETQHRPDTVTEKGKRDMATKADIKRLFGEADKATAAVDEARKGVEVAQMKRSTAVKAIVEATGSKGPFKFNGNVVNIRSRDLFQTDEDGEPVLVDGKKVKIGENFYFVNMGEKELIEV